jgi:hypothetical protein
MHHGAAAAAEQHFLNQMGASFGASSRGCCSRKVRQPPDIALVTRQITLKSIISHTPPHPHPSPLQPLGGRQLWPTRWLMHAQDVTCNCRVYAYHVNLIAPPAANQRLLQALIANLASAAGC